MRISLLLIAAGCSALAGAVFLVYEVERGAVDRALMHYLAAFLLAAVVPALAVPAWRALTKMRGFVPSVLVYSVVAAAVAATFGVLLWRL